MIFDDRELAIIIDALQLSIGELENQIATCPDWDEFAYEIHDLESRIAERRGIIEQFRQYQRG